jgi:hypothetical protein
MSNHVGKNVVLHLYTVVKLVKSLLTMARRTVIKCFTFVVCECQMNKWQHT